jgi:hypothetical protein
VEVGILRLRGLIRFANQSATLRMTIWCLGEMSGPMNLGRWTAEGGCPYIGRCVLDAKIARCIEVKIPTPSALSLQKRRDKDGAAGAGS